MLSIIQQHSDEVASESTLSFIESVTPLIEGRFPELEVPEKRLVHCLGYVLDGLHYQGSLHHIAEALPYKPTHMDITALRRIISNLGYQSKEETLPLGQIDARLLPAMFFDEGKIPLVILERSGNIFTIYDSRQDSIRRVTIPENTVGTIYVFSPLLAGREPSVSLTVKEWFMQFTRRFHNQVVQLLLLSFFINTIILSTPIFIMAVYDHVLSISSPVTLLYLGMGVMLAVGAEAWLRHLRAKGFSYIAARLSYIINLTVFERLINLPSSFTERAPVAAQIARLKDADALKDFFTSNTITVFVELPFTLVAIGVIAAIAGPLSLIPLLMVGIYLSMMLCMKASIKKRMTKAATAATRRQEFAVETVTKMRALRYTGTTEKWSMRFRSFSGEAALSSFRSTMLAQVIDTIAYVIMVGSGIATLAFGINRVIEGAMTSGALIATMILVWRVLGPIQSIFSSLSRIEHAVLSTKQVKHILDFAPEHDAYARAKPMAPLDGKITFNRVGLTYMKDSEPALLGVSFSIQPGQIVAIKGDNGSGKSSILKLIAGMYRPQSGSIQIDDTDIRQFNPVELRRTIAYVPQNADFFSGTIAENLRLVNPIASDQELMDALVTACAYEDVQQLPNGLQTVIGTGKTQQLPFMLIQRLCLARAYLKNAPILLLDEASHSLGKKNDEAFVRMIENMRGKRTVLMVTHREDHMRMADLLLVMDKGLLTLNGNPENIINHLHGARA